MTESDSPALVPETRHDAEAPPTSIHLSRTAVARIREMLEEEELGAEGGLRISARLGAGCSVPLSFDLTLEEEPRSRDLVLAGEGVRLFLDPRSAWVLDGLEVDFVDAPGLGAGFAFRHPRGAGRRSC